MSNHPVEESDKLEMLDQQSTSGKDEFTAIIEISGHDGQNIVQLTNQTNAGLD